MDAVNALYLSHTGMSEPLGRSQVVPYVRGLVRSGWRMHIVSFEPATAGTDDIAATAALLGDYGIGYDWARRSVSHSTATKAFEASKAFLLALRRALRTRPRIVHARSYLPAAVAEMVSTLVPQSRFLFDVRGLLGEEYIDAGHWTAQSFQYRLLKVFERRLFARADGVVVLTHRHRQWLTDETHLLDPRTPVEVVPCCVDVERFQFVTGDRARTRDEIKAGSRFVLCYSGSLGSWYCEEEMARLFAAIRRHRPALFAVYTRSPTGRLAAALEHAGVAAEDVRYVRVSPVEMPRFLAASDAAVSFITPCFSKLGSSPTKVGEYLAIGLPVIMNRGIGDSDRLIDEVEAVVDAGTLTVADIEQAAARAVALDLAALRPVARQAAVDHFSLDTVGIPRYRRLYEAMAPGG
jgi:glycosyltransferase involved in cell wall biosynthesis